MHKLPPFPDRYSAEMVCSNGDRKIFFVDGLKMRMEDHPTAGDDTILIRRPDKRVIWLLSPKTKTYSQTKMPTGMEHVFNPDTLYDWTEDGMITIDRRKCRKFVGRYKSARASIGKAHEVCYVDAKTSMRRRVVSFDMKGKLVATVDYLKAKTCAPPQQVFELPDGYKRAYQRKKRIVS